ncbi:MAG: ABC transporter ATP-binding protein [Clostridia bacterium]|nr:ABC transporter ATP-binding protein [Clostridia bacterium]
MALLECKGLTKSYGAKEVLKDVNLTIERGKIIGLLGQNGAGKTTLIKLINDLLTPTSGEILFNGEKIGVESKKHIAYLSERTSLDKDMTVEQIIRFYADFFEDFDEERARKLLADMHLDVKQQLKKMSKGMQEKVQLVLVMSRRAWLYVLDEPIGGVDPATRDYVLDTIISNFSEDASVLITTHLVSDIERILDEVIFIGNGGVLLQGNADEIRERENTSLDGLFRRMFR